MYKEFKADVEYLYTHNVISEEAYTQIQEDVRRDDFDLEEAWKGNSTYSYDNYNYLRGKISYIHTCCLDDIIQELQDIREKEGNLPVMNWANDAEGELPIKLRDSHTTPYYDMIYRGHTTLGYIVTEEKNCDKWNIIPKIHSKYLVI